jgi:hypothetical protein
MRGIDTSRCSLHQIGNDASGIHNSRGTKQVGGMRGRQVIIVRFSTHIPHTFVFVKTRIFRVIFKIGVDLSSVLSCMGCQGNRIQP